MTNTILAQVFFRTFRRSGEGRELVFEAQVAPGAPLAAILDAAREQAGMGKGGGSSGVFEVQTDEGIWSTTCKVLRPSNGTFKTWEQIEAEELAERAAAEAAA